jgi:hypothetical protein
MRHRFLDLLLLNNSENKKLTIIKLTTPFFNIKNYKKSKKIVKINLQFTIIYSLQFSQLLSNRKSKNLSLI